ncbi:MAG: Hpt domain-containing protein [Gemmatimonadaceae bacterium]
MSSPPASFLDFFVLEASEYVEQIDGLLSRAADATPDFEALQRAARALRGSATMAKLGSFAELASAVEAVGRSLRQGTLPWDPALKGVLTSTVDDFKILVRAARAWTPTEDQWAMKRVAELGRFVQLPGGTPTPIQVSGVAFFASEANNIAAGLELLATRPDNRAGGASVLARVRALRGVAGVRDVPALAEVSEAAEAAVRPLELGEPRLSPAHVNLLRVSADLLRAVAAGLSAGQTVTTSTPQYRAFLTALDGVVANTSADRIIPISDLFFDDKGPTVVSVAPNPPTTPAQRFRMEVVSLGEHLHRVIDEARAATDAIQQEHAKGELGRALRAIRATAASFGQMAVAQTVEAYLERTGDLNASALDAISTFAATISPASAPPTHAAHATVPLRATHQREVVAAIGKPGPLPTTPATTPPPRPASAPGVAAAPPAGHARVFAAVTQPPPAASSPLDATIATFEALSGERMAEPVAIDDDVVPVDALLYRGRAALDRAVELRDAIRRGGGPPSQEMLEELYDLVELARVE